MSDQELNFNELSQQAAEFLEDQNNATSGGTYTPPAEGVGARLRLVGYIELGEHLERFQDKTKRVDKVALIFEVHGKKWPVKEVDGKKIPERIEHILTKSTNEKSKYHKLFKAMNWQGKHTHFVQMVGEAFLGDVYHDKFTLKNGPNAGKEMVKAELINPQTKEFTIRKPMVNDPEDPEQLLPVSVPEAVGSKRAYVWKLGGKKWWDSIYIPGERDGKSLNRYQGKIATALNLVGSPAEELVKGLDTSALDKAMDKKPDSHGAGSDSDNPLED